MRNSHFDSKKPKPKKGRNMNKQLRKIMGVAVLQQRKYSIEQFLEDIQNPKSPYFLLQYMEPNPLNPNDVYDLLRKDWLHQDSIRINQNKISDYGAEMILGSTIIQKIQNLHMAWNFITSAGLSTMPEVFANSLINLSLDNNPIYSKGIKFLIKAQMPSLQNLSLYLCDIGNQGAKHMIKGNWKNLKYLTINQNKIGFTGYLSLRLNNWEKFSKFQCANFYCQFCCHDYFKSQGIGYLKFKIALFHFIVWKSYKITVYDHYYQGYTPFQQQLITIIQKRQNF